LICCCEWAYGFVLTLLHPVQAGWGVDFPGVKSKKTSQTLIISKQCVLKHFGYIT
jgi:hypothetical protein